MNNRREKLVGRNLLDGLLLGINEENRGIATKMGIECGYNPTHPHAFYPVAVVTCLSARLAYLLCPMGSEREAHYTLGIATVTGYSHTIAGITVISRQRPMSVAELLGYYVPLISHEISTVGHHVELLDEYHGRVSISDCPLHPAFLQGCLMQMLETAGCQYPECTYQEADGNCIYQLSWQQAPDEVKARLFLKLGA